MSCKTKTNHEYIQGFCKKYKYSISIKTDNFSKVRGENKFNICIYYKGVSTTPQFRENLAEYFGTKAVSNGGIVDTLGRVIVESQVRVILTKL